MDTLALELDPRNPRLARDEEGAGQQELLRIMIERFKVDDLAESILASGYNTFDPLVGWRHDNVVTVLEGNRRVATLQLLLAPERAPDRHRAKWTALAARVTEELRGSIRRVDLRIYIDRNAVDVTSYIGFRHVTGVLKWPALEKAEFIGKMVETHGWTYDQVADRLGSYARHVERHYIAYRMVEQAREDRIDGADQMAESFGVSLRALQASGISEFLGVTYPADPEQSRRPVPETQATNFGDFVKWTFGTPERTRILPDSRRLTDWGTILQSTEAVSYLRRTPNPDFDRAYFKSGGQAASLVEALYTASDRLEESVPLVEEHRESDEVKDAVAQCARFLGQIVRHFPDAAARLQTPATPAP
ncbi:MAG: hypothetical protein ABJC24_00100 [Chloroflexota bacterium]